MSIDQARSGVGEFVELLTYMDVVAGRVLETDERVKFLDVVKEAKESLEARQTEESQVAFDCAQKFFAIGGPVFVRIGMAYMDQGRSYVLLEKTLANESVVGTSAFQQMQYCWPEAER